MKPKFHRHSCPKCGHLVGWYRRYVQGWIWARWRCEWCQSELRFDLGRRFLSAGMFGLWIGFLGLYVLTHVAFWVSAVLYLAGGVALFGLDRIRSVREEQETASPVRKPKDIGT